jgi:iron-sulfur cluster repair protein YtfE (RIC family)
MEPIARLKRDHRVLRSKFDVLESALRMGPETWFVLREVCYSLSRQLADHLKREDALLASCREAIGPATLAKIERVHHDEPGHLRKITRLFVQEPLGSFETLKIALEVAIEGLRLHMAEEEREVFPILEEAMKGRETVPDSGAPSQELHELMTVNRIVQEFPCTRRTFEQLFVNIPFEGCQCLDEVAWRHGMESRELLSTLETVIREECATKPREAMTTFCHG